MTNKLSLFNSFLFQNTSDFLTSKGFCVSKKNRLFYYEADRFEKIIGFRKSRSGKNDYAVFFGVWSIAFEGEVAANYKKKIDCFCNITYMDELSPVAPMQNTFWWDVQENDDASLEEQIRTFALPCLDTFKTLDDVIYMLDKHPNRDETTIEKLLKESPSYPSLCTFNYENIEEKCINAFSFLLKNGFIQESRRFYRRRGDIFDVLSLSYLAAHRFLRVDIYVWHPVLEGLSSMPAHLPEDITTITWRNLAGDDTHMNGGPFFTGENNLDFENYEPIILDYFSKIRNQEDVINSIRPECKPYFTC